MATARDYYAILDVTPDATPGAIRDAYRRLAKRWHPDRFATAPEAERTRAERQMAALNRAYAVLGQPARRRAYDLGDPTDVDGPGPSPVTPPWDRPATAAAWRGAHAPVSRNPNGAGDLFGVLGLILAASLFIGTLNGSFGQGAGAVVPLALAGALAAAGGWCFSSASPLARLGRGWAEGEPAGVRPRGAPAERVVPGDADDDMEAAAFDALVDEALATIPEDFAARMPNISVQVKEEPSPADLVRSGVPAGHTLLGLYEGVPLTHHGQAGAGPEVISIYRGPIRRHCHSNPDRIRAQVRATVLHEIAHHFGLDHEHMPDWLH